MSKVRIAVAGAGRIGRRHIEELLTTRSAELAAVVEPGPSGSEIAGRHRVQHYPDLQRLLDQDPPDGDRKSTRLNSSHTEQSRMPSSA